MPRKKADIFYIYKTTCIVTGKYYVGMHGTANINDGYLGSGKRLRHSIRKYGKENHVREILEYCDNRELLIEREKELITEDMLYDKQCMNLMSGGTGGFITFECCSNAGKIGGAIQKQKIENDINYKEKISNILINNIKQAHKNKKYKYNNNSGKKHSEETRVKISDGHKKYVGELSYNYNTCWINKNGVNKKIKKENIDLYFKDNWIKGKIKLMNHPLMISIDKKNKIKELYIQLKSFKKVAKELNISKSTVIKYINET